MALPRQVTPDDDTIGEEWIRDVDYGDPTGVTASRAKSGGWHVYVDILELVREGELERMLREAVDRALREVTGVAEVEEEDREVYFVTGEPRGDALVTAAGGAIEPFVDAIRRYVAAS
jgi:hypothetical protein